MKACMDLGSNSFHLLIGRWRDGEIEVVERCSERVLLGEGVRASGRISDAAMARGLDCLSTFHALMRQHPVERYWALGTNTFRVARNAGDFIDAAAEQGVRISTISGVQEAVLIYAGVLSALPEDEARRLVVDIGGGSTEVIVGHGSDRLLTQSLTVGSVTWRDSYFAQGETTLDQVESGLEQGLADARSSFASIAPAVRAAGWDQALASSGTIKMLAGICNAHGFAEGEVSQEALLTLRPLFVTQAVSGGELAGLKERRRDLLLAGWCVLLGLMQAYEVEKIRFSATALREGMLDFMVRNQRTLNITQEADLPGLRRPAQEL